MNTKDCKFLNTIPEYLEGLLTSQERTDFEEHLKSCVVCNDAVERYKSLEMLLSKLPEKNAPEELKSRVLSKLKSEKIKKSPINIFSYPFFVKMGEIAAVFLLVFVGWHFYSQRLIQPAQIKKATLAQKSQYLRREIRAEKIPSTEESIAKDEVSENRIAGKLITEKQASSPEEIKFEEDSKLKKVDKEKPGEKIIERKGESERKEIKPITDQIQVSPLPAQGNVIGEKQAVSEVAEVQKSLASAIPEPTSEKSELIVQSVSKEKMQTEYPKVPPASQPSVYRVQEKKSSGYENAPIDKYRRTSYSDSLSNLIITANVSKNEFLEWARQTREILMRVDDIDEQTLRISIYSENEFERFEKILTEKGWSVSAENISLLAEIKNAKMVSAGKTIFSFIIKFNK